MCHGCNSMQWKHIKDVTTFSWDFLKIVLRNNSGNVVTSPLSVSVLLAMVQQGAEGATLSQLTTVLRAAPPENLQDFSQLSHCYKLGKKKALFYFENGMFVEQMKELKSHFFNTIVHDFLADITEVDFMNDKKQCIKNINNWASAHTNGTITNVITQDAINKNTNLVLLNVIYFKDIWRKVFTDLRPLQFNQPGSVSSNVTGMFLLTKLIANKNKNIGIKWVSLPFRDSQFSLLVILPIKKNALEIVTQTLTGNNLHEIIEDRTENMVQLALPKFKLETNQDCIPVLRELGVTHLFSLAEANLSSIMLTKTEVNFVYVSYVGNKVEFEVDENGATATIAANVAGTEGRTRDSIMDFHANHPFLVFLIDNINRLPLLAGRVSDPSQR
ncbi:leukocyte elastase inhibitor-like [Periplaneta americana]|uniref:leukocyte elastase inhibitor-like n=1 Tax=Periplaneta americana TaxID=6978 RepID=UPI0037E83EA6